MAEPYTGSIPANVMQALRDYLLDYLYNTYSWENTEMSLYYFLGNGQGITLEQMGHLEPIRDYYTQHYLIRFQDQIRNKAEQAPFGEFYDDFDKGYNFEDVFYSYRESGVEGIFIGEIKQGSNDTRIVSGNMHFRFYDQFKDPLSFAQSVVTINNIIPYVDPIKEIDLWQWFREAANLWQKPYPITGSWEIDYREIIP